jgi:hypothetical protein
MARTFSPSSRGNYRGFVPGTFGELLGVSYDPDDYERHSWSRRL